MKLWTTFNEATAFTSFRYWPPSGCSYPFGFVGNSSDGNSTVEPYIVGHLVLLSHATMVELYQQKFPVIYCKHVKIPYIE